MFRLYGKEARVVIDILEDILLWCFDSIAVINLKFRLSLCR